MGNTILTPGEENVEQTPNVVEETIPYLIKDNYLNEYTDNEKAKVRENLGVYSTESVYDKKDTDDLVNRKIREIYDNYLDTDDPLISRETAIDIITKKVQDFISKKDKAELLDDIEEIQSNINSHINKKYENDPHKVIPVIQDKLDQNYVKKSDVYYTDQLYTKNQIDNLLNGYAKLNSSNSFTKPQIGANPKIGSHLATKNYVDAVMNSHLVDVDPHNFISILNKRLALYAKSSQVYNRTETYSRDQIDSVIRSLVTDAFRDAILDHLNEFDPHNILSEVRKERYIKQDGTIPFRSPQKGIDAIDPQDLVTLHQVEEKISNIQEAIDNVPEPIWITSGPVQSTVGHVDDNTEVPEVMTLQEIMDAIFYGTGISLEIPDFVVITESCPITMCVRGGFIQYAELYQDEELIYTFQKEDFENGCITVDSNPLFKDTEFTFKVYYPNGSSHEETKIVNCYMPVFVGLLPKWKFGNTVTMDYLIELCKEDTEGTQNRFVNQGKNLTSFTFKYEFQDPNLRHIFIALPKEYPDLDTMVTKSQSFNKEAFDVIDMIPFKIPGVEEDVIFKLYIYRQALSSLNQDVTFNFEQ